MTRTKKSKRPANLPEFPNEGPYRIYPAYRDVLPSEDTDLLYVPCDCGKWHTHGAAGKTFGSGDGGRAPHCLDRDRNPERRPYVLKEVGMFPEEWRHHLRP